MEATLVSAEGVYRQLYKDYLPLMRFMGELGAPMPSAFRTAAEVILNSDLYRAITRDELDVYRIASLLEEAQTWQTQLDTAGLSYGLEQVLTERAQDVQDDPLDLDRVDRLEYGIDLARKLPFAVDVSRPQDVIYRLLNGSNNGRRKDALANDPQARQRLEDLARKLSIRVSS